MFDFPLHADCKSYSTENGANKCETRCAGKLCGVYCESSSFAVPRNERFQCAHFTVQSTDLCVWGDQKLFAQRYLFYRRRFSKEDRLIHDGRDGSNIPRRNKCLHFCQKLSPFRQSRSKMKDAVRDDGKDYKFNESGCSSVIGRCSPTVQLKTSFCCSKRQL